MTRLLPVLLLALALSACSEDEAVTAKPPPQDLTREAIGYYCQMIVADHQGPKAQIFIEGRSEPLWFSSVRDAVAFTLLPDEPKTVTALYVNDMGAATWAAPEPGTWIEAESAHFVIGSARRGGMGAREAVPFSSLEAARAFAAEQGGRIVAYAEIPPDYILSDDAEAQQPGHSPQEAGHGAH